MNELVRFEPTEWEAIKTNWKGLKALVLESIKAASSRRSYDAALDNWRDWYDAAPEPRPQFFSKASVNGFKSHLEARGLAPQTINVQLAAVRKLAVETSDNIPQVCAPEVAAAICRVKGAKRLGVRIGNWLSEEQAAQLTNAPDNSIAGYRDRAVLAVFYGIGLRRSEVASLRFEQLVQREGQWIFADLVGKHGRVRSPTVPPWVKDAIDLWAQAAGIQPEGYIFRPVNRGGHICGDRIRNAHSLWLTCRKYAAALNIQGFAPHDMRRTCAMHCREHGAPIEYISALLGHASVQTTERYLPRTNLLKDAPNYRIPNPFKDRRPPAA
jgi:integrase